MGRYIAEGRIVYDEVQRVDHHKQFSKTLAKPEGVQYYHEDNMRRATELKKKLERARSDATRERYREELRQIEDLDDIGIAVDEYAREKRNFMDAMSIAPNDTSKKVDLRFREFLRSQLPLVAPGINGAINLGTVMGVNYKREGIDVSDLANPELLDMVISAIATQGRRLRIAPHNYRNAVVFKKYLDKFFN